MENKTERYFYQLKEKILNTNKILITSHENPDGDAIGSVLAFNLIYKKLNPQANTFLYIPGQTPSSLSFLPDFSLIKNNISEGLDPDILICLDYGDFKRLKLPESLLNKISSEKIISIDHHQGEQKGELKIIDTKVSSTCEIIYWWLKKTEFLEIDRDIANCLLTGIVSDTGGFSHISTSFNTFQAVSDLLSKGVQWLDIVKKSLSPFSYDFLEIFGKVLSRTQAFPRYGLVYSWLSFDDLKEKTISLADLNGVASIISKETSCNYALFLVEYKKGEIKGSLRSEPFKGKRVDEIAKKLGGGGHPYAAGFIQKGEVEEVLKKVIEVLK